MKTRDPAPGLVRGLGLWATLAVVVGAMIGQAVFLVPSDVAREVGSAPRLLLVWLVGGVLVLFGSFCYGELGAAMPQAGGDYIYLGRGLTPLLGFLYGWTNAMIIRPGSAAIIAAGTSRFAVFLWPSLAASIFTWNISLPFHAQPFRFTFASDQPLAALVIAVAATLNYLGVRMVGRMQMVLTSFKVLLVMAIVILAFIPAETARLPAESFFAPAPGMVVAFLTALVPVMTAYNGFAHIGALGGEIVNAQKNLPRAAIFGTLLVVTVYLLINIAFLRVLGFAGVAHSQHVASDALVRLVGGGASRWFTVALMISAFGSLHSGFLTGPRVTYAMAREGYFFAFAKSLHPVFCTPGGATVFQGCAAAALVLTGTYRELYSYTMFAVGIFFALTACALVRLRATQPEMVRPYRVWGYPCTVALFGLAAFAISMNTWLVRPVRSSIGLAIILLGVPFFFHWRQQLAPLPALERQSSAAVSK